MAYELVCLVLAGERCWKAAFEIPNLHVSPTDSVGTLEGFWFRSRWKLQMIFGDESVIAIQTFGSSLICKPSHICLISIAYKYLFILVQSDRG